MSEKYLPIIGSNYFYPILYLLEQVNGKYSNKINSVQVSPLENGYAVAIITLTVFCLESYLIRSRQIMIDFNKYEKPLRKEHVIDFFKNGFKNEILLLELTELIIIRDVIAHNHIWDVDIDWTTNGLEFANEPKHLGRPLFGDKKFETNLNVLERKTRELKLNIFPTKIGTLDAIKVIKSMYKILKLIEDTDCNFCCISNIPVFFNGESMQFGEFIAFLSDVGFDMNKFKNRNNDSNDNIAEAELD
ncbi:MAG: hypothetical protein ABIJ45_08630 [Candidatus Zixiibacteriota bacterium]